MGMVKHSQSSLNSNSALSLKCLKKEVRDNVDFLNADKKVSYRLISTLWALKEIQGNTNITDEHDQAFSKYSK